MYGHSRKPSADADQTPTIVDFGLHLCFLSACALAHLPFAHRTCQA